MELSFWFVYSRLIQSQVKMSVALSWITFVVWSVSCHHQIKNLAPLSTQIRTKSRCHLSKLAPNLWGEGPGVRGISVDEGAESIGCITKYGAQETHSRFIIDFCSSPPAPLLVNSVFACLEWIAFPSEFTRRGELVDLSIVFSSLLFTAKN